MRTRMQIVIYVIALLAVLIAPANAAVEFNDKTEIVLTVFIPCANGGVGEVVELSGTLHTLITANINGNNVSGKFHFQPQGLSGTGETTGATYQGTGVTQQTFTGSLRNGQTSFNFLNNFRIIGQDSGNNFLLQENLRFTIYADGTMTVSHDNFSIDCK